MSKIYGLDIFNRFCYIQCYFSSKIRPTNVSHRGETMAEPGTKKGRGIDGLLVDLEGR